MDPKDEQANDDLVVAPGGPLPKSHTHFVPPGHVVRTLADGSVMVEPEPEAEQGD